ncbi:MAG: ketoacyl-ACP synthase III [Spirochaetaceae bacterium]|nr:ketoacyl-ACP synthase III [Spirochaetaceae bacterium]
MAVIVKSTGKALPKRRVTNDELPKELETNDEWIASHTGIRSRYIAGEGETCAALGAEACRSALKAAGIAASGVGLIICATATPDNSGFPSAACVIQAALGATNAVCFDVTAACSGFLYAMDIATSMMERSGYKYALIVGAEVLSRICDWKDRTSCILFGDGAGAALLERCDATEGAGIGSFVSGSDGTGGNALYVDRTGVMKMDGHAIYTFAVKIITEIIKELMERENLRPEDVDYFVCHQANERILSAAAKRLELDFSKFFITLDEYGNTSSASIPLTLADMDSQGLLKKGTTIVTAAFGAGLTWAGTVIRF